jgi:hypothetical protein
VAASCSEAGKHSPQHLQHSLVRVPPSDNDKCIKMRTSDTLASVTTMFAKREHHNSKSTSSSTPADSASNRQHSSGQPASQPALLSLAQASHCSRSFTDQPASPPSLALAIPLLQELQTASCRHAGSQSPGYLKVDR